MRKGLCMRLCVCVCVKCDRRNVPIYTLSRMLRDDHDDDDVDD